MKWVAAVAGCMSSAGQQPPRRVQKERQATHTLLHANCPPPPPPLWQAFAIAVLLSQHHWNLLTVPLHLVQLPVLQGKLELGPAGGFGLDQSAAFRLAAANAQLQNLGFGGPLGGPHGTPGAGLPSSSSAMLGQQAAAAAAAAAGLGMGAMGLDYGSLLSQGGLPGLPGLPPGAGMDLTGQVSASWVTGG